VDDRRISKRLSYILRHSPESASIRLEPQGWASVVRLLDAVGISRDVLDHIVRTNTKRRFEFDASGTRIRARQGHSVPVDLGYDPLEPLDLLYHGTARKNLTSIRTQGLLKMKRHHVHLSEDADTAYQVGSRHGKSVVLVVAAKEMHAEGVKFCRTGNDVWLVEYVPPTRLSLNQGGEPLVGHPG